MARKKVKKEESINYILSDNKVDNVNVGYKGDVKISVIKRNKTVSIKKFKNSGRYPLFQFIVECLAGNYKNADIHRPYSLALFTIGSKDVQTKEEDLQLTKIYSNIKEYGIGHYATAEKRVTYGDVVIKTVPKVEVKSNVIGNASITYTFNIPFSHIYTESDTGINLICLYDRENRRIYDNPSAFFFSVDENTQKVVNLVDSELLKDNSAVNYNLIIEWTLNISNLEEGDIE